MVASIYASLRNRWSALSRREKRMVEAAAAVVLIALLYALVWLPMRNATGQLAQDLPRLRHQVARMRVQADALAARPSSAAEIADRTVPHDAALRALAARTQVATSLAQLEPGDGGSIRLGFDAVSGDALIGFLELAQSEGHWRVRELQLARLSGGGRVRAELTLTGRGE